MVRKLESWEVGRAMIASRKGYAVQGEPYVFTLHDNSMYASKAEAEREKQKILKKYYVRIFYYEGSYIKDGFLIYKYEKAKAVSTLPYKGPIKLNPKAQKVVNRFVSGKPKSKKELIEMWGDLGTALNHNNKKVRIAARIIKTTAKTKAARDEAKAIIKDMDFEGW